MVGTAAWVRSEAAAESEVVGLAADSAVSAAGEVVVAAAARVGRIAYGHLHSTRCAAVRSPCRHAPLGLLVQPLRVTGGGSEGTVGSGPESVTAPE